MKKLLYVFTFIGLISTINFIYSKINEHQILKLKHLNCEKIKPGMTLKSARKILKDDLTDWANDLSGKIVISTSTDSLPIYYIIYKPYLYAQSEFMIIHFDPNTLKVTGVECGDNYRKR